MVRGAKWHFAKHPRGLTGYARTVKMVDGEQKYLYMHQVIMGVDAGREIDHIDGNGLNNRRSNLRHVTHSENMMACVIRLGRQHKPKPKLPRKRGYTIANATNQNTVHKRLADGSIRTYFYDRRTGERLSEPRTKVPANRKPVG